MKSLTLLGLACAFTLIAAIPYSHSVESIENDNSTSHSFESHETSARMSSLHDFIKKGRFLMKMKGCFAEVKEDPNVMQSIKNCSKNFETVKAKFHNGTFPTKDEMKTYIGNFSICIYSELSLIDASGKLDFNKLRDQAKLTNFTGNSDKIKAMSAILTKCINDSQNMTGSTIDIVRKISQCKDKGLANYCRSIGEPIGAWEYIGALSTLAEDSPCNNVIVPSSVDQVYAACITELKAEPDSSEETVHDWHTKDGTKIPYKTTKERKSWAKSDKVKETKVLQCALRKSGFVTGLGSNAVLNWTAVETFAANFSGWSNIPQLRDGVFAAFNNCSATANATHQIRQQLKDFIKCYLPQYSNYCGLNNNVAKFFFPVLRDELMPGLFMKILNMMAMAGAGNNHPFHFGHSAEKP